MSISKNIGRFARNISKLRHKRGYFKAKRFTVSFIKKIPLVGNGLFRAIRWFKKSVKNLIYSSNYFEDLGLYYLGPADGNNYEDVEALLEAAKNAAICKGGVMQKKITALPRQGKGEKVGQEPSSRMVTCRAVHLRSCKVM